MNDKKYILTKLFKNNIIPLLLLCVVMILFFVCFHSKPDVLAGEQLAYVEYSVNLLKDESSTNISTESKIVSSVESANISFNNLDISLNSKSKLELVYLVENITNSTTIINLDLSNLFIENFKIEFFFNNEQVDEINHQLNLQERGEIKVLISIEDLSKNSSLYGGISLDIALLGGADE